MPNHVTNKLLISGPQQRLVELQNSLAGKNSEGENSPFTFQAITPMPEYILEIRDGSDLPFALWLTDEGAYQAYINKQKTFHDIIHNFLARHDQEQRTMIERFCRYFNCDVQTREEAIEWASEHRPMLWGQGERVSMALEECGCKSWYDWSCENWGTKWDAYDIAIDIEPGCLTYFFDTAWSHPKPIIVKIAALYPDLVLEHRYFDEGYGFWGIEIYKDGELSDSQDTEQSDFQSLCLELKGYDPLEDDEDQDESVPDLQGGQPSEKG